MQNQAANSITFIKGAPKPEFVLPACPHCGAPAVYHSKNEDPTESIKKSWPALFVDPFDERNGKQVGDICPQCANVRPDRVPVDEWRAMHPVES
jgi:hypothetical protein